MDHFDRCPWCGGRVQFFRSEEGKQQLSCNGTYGGELPCDWKMDLPDETPAPPATKTA